MKNSRETFSFRQYLSVALAGLLLISVVYVRRAELRAMMGLGDVYAEQGRVAESTAEPFAGYDSQEDFDQAFEEAPAFDSFSDLLSDVDSGSSSFDVEDYDDVVGDDHDHDHLVEVEASDETTVPLPESVDVTSIPQGQTEFEAWAYNNSEPQYFTRKDGSVVQIPACDTANMVTITAFGKTLTIHKEVVPFVRDVEAEWLAAGGSSFYSIRSIGGYSCRKTTGGTRMSQHAWGFAIDINPRENPYISRVASLADVGGVETIIGGFRVKYSAPILYVTYADHADFIADRDNWTDQPESFVQMWRDNRWGWLGAKDSMHYSIDTYGVCPQLCSEVEAVCEFCGHGDGGFLPGQRTAGMTAYNDVQWQKYADYFGWDTDTNTSSDGGDTTQNDGNDTQTTDTQDNTSTGGGNNDIGNDNGDVSGGSSAWVDDPDTPDIDESLPPGLRNKPTDHPAKKGGKKNKN